MTKPSTDHAPPGPRDLALITGYLADQHRGELKQHAQSIRTLCEIVSSKLESILDGDDSFFAEL
jgi:hypothetical protein